MYIVIISGGTLESKYASALLKAGKKVKVIAVDGGLMYCQEQGIVPDYIVGDFDTVDKKVLKEFRKNSAIKIREYNPCKDVTDTQAAVSLAIEMLEQAGETGEKINIWLLGATGSRMDHTMANMGCLLEVLNAGYFMKIVDGNNCMYAYTKSFILEREELLYQKYLSLIAMEKVSGLCIHGMKYEVENIELPVLSGHGVSNELLEERAEVKFTSGTILVIESKD